MKNQSVMQKVMKAIGNKNLKKWDRKKLMGHFSQYVPTGVDPEYFFDKMEEQISCR